jgi:plasmid stability protein
MPTLQIRDLPQHVYQALAVRARRNRRSLAQQAIVDLARFEEVNAHGRRLAVLTELRRRLEQGDGALTGRAPADLVREDRER